MSNSSNFDRVLGRWDILALAFGAMIGWGWVVLAGDWVLSAGMMGVLTAFIIGGIAMVLIGLTYSELAAAMPQVGGEHVYSERALGVGWSFVCTWAIILGYVSVVAFEAVALPTVLEYLAPNYKQVYLWTVAGWDVYLTWVLVGVGGSLAMTWINYRGVQTAALVQKVVTLGILAVGLMLITGALFNGDVSKADPVFVDGAKGIMAVVVMIPFMFVGFDVIPQAAEEIDMPAKQIGKMLIVSVLMAVFWYTFISMAVAVAMNAEEIKNSNLAVADAMSALVGGSWGGKLVVIAGICGIITSWNAFYVGGSRAIYAMAKAGLLPSFLAKLHPVYKTPVNAIFLIGFFSVIAPLFGRKAMVWLVDAGGFGIVIAYLFVAISFLALRKNEPTMERPFKVAAGGFVGWSAIILSVGLAVMYLPKIEGLPLIGGAALTPEEWIMVGGWIGLGLVLFLVAKFTNKSSAH